VIAGLFAQSRSLFVIGFAAWLGLCVYVGGLLDGNRAYSGILSGYTVALVAVTQIDSPQNIFSAGVNRGAAIVVGIAALALISDGLRDCSHRSPSRSQIRESRWRRILRLPMSLM
jgi:uncharacterized membrane protein YccC